MALPLNLRVVSGYGIVLPADFKDRRNAPAWSACVPDQTLRFSFDGRGLLCENDRF